MKEQLISEKVALLAKKAGFTISLYENLSFVSAYYKGGRLGNYWNDPEKTVAVAPEQEFLRKWLRESLEVDITINVAYSGIIRIYSFEVINSLSIGENEVDKDYDSYEDALEDALELALEMFI